MNIFSKIFAKFNKKGYRSSINRESSFSFSNTDIATNETIYAAISQKVNSLSGLPLKLYKDYKVVNATENPIARILEYNPYGYMTTLNWIRAMETHRNVYGNAYSMKIYGSKYQLIGFELLNPNYVEPVIEKESKDLWYKISKDGKENYIHNSHIIHVNTVFTANYKGISPLKVLRNTLDYDREVKEFSINQMKNGLKANIAIKIDSKLSEESLKLYDEMIGRFKKNGILYIDSGKNIQELKNTSFIDPRVFDVEKITIERVARVFDIPISKLTGKTEGSKNSENAELDYYKDAVLPVIRLYEAELDKKVLTEREKNEGYSHKFNLNGLMRADMKTRGDFYFKGIRSAWFTPNEVRRLEEMEPLKGGDSLYVSRDLVPIDKIDLILKGGEKKSGE